MRRRILTLALLLPAVFPLAARATAADLDPNGQPLTADSLAWLESIARAVLAFFGV